MDAIPDDIKALIEKLKDLYADDQVENIQWNKAKQKEAQPFEILLSEKLGIDGVEELKQEIENNKKLSQSYLSLEEIEVLIAYPQNPDLIVDIFTGTHDSRVVELLEQYRKTHTVWRSSQKNDTFGPFSVAKKEFVAYLIHLISQKTGFDRNRELDAYFSVGNATKQLQAAFKLLSQNVDAIIPALTEKNKAQTTFVHVQNDNITKWNSFFAPILEKEAIKIQARDSHVDLKKEIP